MRKQNRTKVGTHRESGKSHKAPKFGNNRTSGNPDKRISTKVEKPLTFRLQKLNRNKFRTRLRGTRKKNEQEEKGKNRQGVKAASGGEASQRTEEKEQGRRNGGGNRESYALRTPRIERRKGSEKRDKKGSGKRKEAEKWVENPNRGRGDGKEQARWRKRREEERSAPNENGEDGGKTPFFGKSKVLAGAFAVYQETANVRVTAED